MSHGALLLNYQSRNFSKGRRPATNIGMKTQPIIVTTQKELIEITLKFLYPSISTALSWDAIDIP